MPAAISERSAQITSASRATCATFYAGQAAASAWQVRRAQMPMDLSNGSMDNGRIDRFQRK